MNTEIFKNMPRNQNNIGMLVLSAIFLVVPLLSWALWIIVVSNNPGASQQEKLAAFYTYFPDFIRDQFMISLLVLAFSILAVVFASFAIQNSSGSSKLVGVFIITAGSFLLLLQLFSMM